MPDIVPCWRTYKTKNDSGEEITVVEKHMMFPVDANEAVKNGQGEWSRREPKGEAIEVAGPLTPVDSETRPERRARKKRHFETDGSE